ncbi:MAG: GNAT family N-acetyltransferase [Candidatus Methylomirabilis oxyfera]|nr:GNAT family N-acetyltransferase [Candidatus Methylomirabilis oxyfera]
MCERPAAAREGDIHRDPADRWIVRAYRPGDEVRILQLFRRVFGVDRSLDRWRWQFQKNPVGRCYVRLAETPSEELVGQYAGLPLRVTLGDRTVIFTQIVDVMVDRRFRLGLKRPGLFAALANEYIGDYLVSGEVPIGYGFPTPEALRIGQRVAGYAPLHPVVRLVLDLGDHQRDPLSWRARCFCVEPVDRFGEDVDRLWAQMRPRVGVATVRDSGYLNWRYADCPDVRYTVLTVRRRFGGDLAGVAVLRLGIADQSVAFLVDWLVPPGDTVVADLLLRHCEQRSREAGMTQLQAWFRPSGWPTQLLLQRGFRSEPTIYHLVALTKIPEISLERLNAQWYYTMGDSDIY